MNILEKLQKQKATLESRGYKACYIAVYGSQNYNLDIYTDEYQSDLDMKAIVVPTLDDLINNSKPISTTITTEWGECDLKDIRSYFTTLLKGNPAYLETLFTPYYIVDDKFKLEFEQIHSMKDDLVYALRAQMIRAMYGMMLEKEKAMCHPYPTIAHKIEKFGYDGKQVHHIYRLWLMMQGYYSLGESLSECLVPPQYEIETLMNFKLNKIPLDSALSFVGDIMAKVKEFRDKVLGSIEEGRIDYSVKNQYQELSKQIIRNKIINEIRGE